MKKIFGIIISLLLIAGSGVGVYYVVKESNVSLTISVEDVEVFEEESQEIKYACNIKDAELLFTVLDTSIARVEKNDDVFVVKGLSAGVTKLTMTAKYNKYKNFSEATITVKEKEEKSNIEIEYELHGTNNFACSGNNIIMYSDEPSIFSVVSSSGDINSVSAYCANTNVVITSKPVNKSFKIDCSVVGSYELVINVNGYDKTYNLSVLQNPNTDTGDEETNEPEEPGEPEGPTVDYTLITQNCSLSGNTITMTSGVNALLQIQEGSDEIVSYDITCESDSVTVTKKALQNMAYTIKCSTAGSYVLKVIVNDILTEYTLVVE